MLSRSWFIGLALLIAFPSVARSLDMVWSNGSSDIVVQTASRCTLLVRVAGVGEQLPGEWRLVWTATAESSEPLAFLTGTPTSGNADVCALAGGSTVEHMLAGVDTVFHCNPDQEGRAAVARYVLQIAAGAIGKVKLLPASVDSVTTGGGLTLEQFPEVTINGGSDNPYPPVLETAQQTRVGSVVELTSTGAYLGGVRSVTLTDVTAAGGASFEVLDQSDTRLTARAEAPGAFPSGFVTVADANGLSTAIPAASVPLATVAIPNDHFLVRFRPGALEPPQGLTAGQAASFQYASTALQESLMTTGVTELERLLPWFEHSDVNSTNLLGEPVVLEDLADLYVAHVPAESDIPALVGRVSAWPEVYYASPDMPLVPSTTQPNDQYFLQQWGPWNTGQTLCGFSGVGAYNTRVADVWDYTRGDPRERIAILDTGIDPYHSDFGGRVVVDTSFTRVGGAYDDDPNRHGTAVAGIAMASGNNTSGVAGVAWYGAPWAIKVFDCQPGFECGGDDSWVIRAVDRCRVKRIPVVNMSFGTNPGDPAIDSA